MSSIPGKNYLVTSVCAHVALFFILIVNMYFADPRVVFENTNQNDVISAVVLGDTAKSKIIPHKVTPPPPAPEPPKKIEKVVEPLPQQQVKVVPVVMPKKDVIALEKPKPKKKVVDQKKLHEKVVAGLLEDIEKEVKKRKKAKPVVADDKKSKEKKHKELAAKFAKELQAVAEQTMRQTMLEEDIRIQGEQARQSQGVVDKFKALIIQSISEHWVIPTQSNRKLSSELMIRLAPGGTVLDVQITRSSGDPALDSSARAAVLKASPLPVPKDAEAFKAFKQFVLKVKPEYVLNGA